MLGLLMTVLVFSLLFLLSFSGMALLVWQMARLLMLLFPFSLYEAMLLSTFFTSFGAYVVWRFSGLTDTLTEAQEEAGRVSRRMGQGPRTDREHVEELLASGDFEREGYKFIPTERFYGADSKRTWEKWLTKEIANDIYAEFQSKPSIVPNSNDTQLQELAIRLAEFGISILKRKTTRARKLTITKSQLVREIEKSGQRAYDDMIIRLAVSAQNMNIDYYYDALIEVVHKKRWKQLTTIEDEA